MDFEFSMCGLDGIENREKSKGPEPPPAPCCGFHHHAKAVNLQGAVFLWRGPLGGVHSVIAFGEGQWKTG